MRAVEAESGSSRNHGKKDPAEGRHLSWGLGKMGVQVKREGTLRKRLGAKLSRSQGSIDKC